MILRRFERETCKWFPFVWTRQTFTMLNTIIWTPRYIILTFTRKTHFHELRNTVYLCRLQPNYDSECEKLTRINLLRGNTHDFTRKKISFFYKQNRWNMILSPYIRENCNWFRFVWTSTTFTTSNNDYNGTKLMILSFTRKRILMSWETPYNFVVYNQTMILNAKSLQEHTYCVETHTI
jgi:hypothetical protein